MNSLCKKLLPLLMLSSVGLTLACRAEAQTTETRLQAEVDRLQGILKKLDATAPDKEKEELTGLGQQLTQVREQKSPSVLVYRLRGLLVEVEKRAYLQAHRDAGSDLSHLEPLWTAEKARFAEASRPVPESPLLAGMAQASENQAQKLYRAALPYGKAAGPGAGFYYLAEAQAQMSLHDFVAGLPFPAGGEKVPDTAVLRATLESLEGEMQKAFAADPAGQDLIPASAMLKEARELLERDFRAGAGLTLLRSRLELSRHEKPEKKPDTQPAAPASQPAEAVAEGSLIAPFAPLAAGEDETARIIRTEMIPLYRSFSRKNK